MSAYLGRPHAPAHGSIAKIRVLDGIAPATEALTVPFLPHGIASLTVVVQPGETMRIVLAGPRTTAVYKRFLPAGFFVHLMLAPDAAREVLGVPLHELTDRIVDVEDVWGKRG